jgi:hypothetical protein
MIATPRRRSSKEIASDGSRPFLPGCVRRERSGLPGVDLLGQTGHFAGSGLFVEHPFFSRFIDNGLGHVKLLNGFVPTLSHGEAHILDNVFYPGLNRFVAQAPTFVLSGSLQC